MVESLLRARKALDAGEMVEGYDEREILEIAQLDFSRLAIGIERSSSGLVLRIS